MGLSELLQPIGNDWFQLRLDADADPVDLQQALQYAQALAEEPGVKLESAVGSRRTSSGEPIHPVAMRLHRTHLPLLGDRELIESSLVSLAVPRLHLRDHNLWWWNQLRDYQAETALWAASRSGSVIVHDLGLGKTRTGLGAAGLPILVLCPKSGVSVWREEAEYAGLRCTLLEGKPPSFDEVVAFLKEMQPATDLWLLNYHVAEYWVRYFSSLGPLQGIHTLIPDEAHYLQKRDLTWTKVINSIQRERCVLLTATAIRNRLRSLWSLLNTACPAAFGKEYEYRKTYCGAVEDSYGLEDGGKDWKASPRGRAALDRLQMRLSEVVSRRVRRPGDVVPLSRHAHEVCVDKEVLHEALDDSVQASAQLKGGAQKIAWYTDMRHRFGMLKVPEAVRLTAKLLNEWPRVVLWVWHEDVAKELKRLLREQLPGEVEIDMILGNTSQKKRDGIATAWKNREGADLSPRVLIASIGAASQAVSFTTAGLAIFVELDWAPLQMQQAEKRTHRFGQVHSRCEVFYCVLKGTIDETIADVLLEKAQECEEVFGVDGQVDQMSALFGVAGDADQGTDEEFMQRVAARLLAVNDQEAW